MYSEEQFKIVPKIIRCLFCKFQIRDTLKFE